MSTTAVGAAKPRSTMWKLRHSAWLLAVILGVGYLSFIGFAYCAFRTREKKWAVLATFFVVATIAGYVVMGSTNDPVFIIELWLGSVVFGLIANRDYLNWRAGDSVASSERENVAARIAGGGSGPAGSGPLDRRAKRARVEQITSQLGAAASQGDAGALTAVPGLVAELHSLVGGWKSDRVLSKAYATAVARVTQDDIVSSDEDAWLTRFACDLGVIQADELERRPALNEDLWVGRINAGRPPVASSARMITRPGEVAYAEFSVSLMKEVTQREWRGSSSGFSVPIGFGVRYRAGAVRGRSVVVGAQLVAEDSGILTVTSTRTVFAGQKKTLEFRHDKLVSVHQFTDGLRLGVSNRQAASLFKFAASPTIAAALISLGGRGA